MHFIRKKPDEKNVRTNTESHGVQSAAPFFAEYVFSPQGSQPVVASLEKVPEGHKACDVPLVVMNEPGLTPRQPVLPGSGW
jgi:hypothetical protein